MWKTTTTSRRSSGASTAAIGSDTTAAWRTTRCGFSISSTDTTRRPRSLCWVGLPSVGPSLVREIHRRGHEIGSHGYWHRLIYEQSPEEFRDDLRLSRDVLQDAIGGPILAYRAPSFSITKRSMWALEILAEEGFLMDSSVFPIRHDRYGIPGARPEMHQIDTPAGSLWEFPMSIVRLGWMNLPVGGGGYFRLYPLRWTLHMLSRINSVHQPFVHLLRPSVGTRSRTTAASGRLSDFPRQTLSQLDHHRKEVGRPLEDLPLRTPLRFPAEHSAFLRRIAYVRDRHGSSVTPSRPKILFLAHRVPYPPNRGDRIRSFHHLAVSCATGGRLSGLSRGRTALAGNATGPRTRVQDVAGLRLGRYRRWINAARSLAFGRTATEGLFQCGRLRRLLARWSRTTRFDAVVVFCSSMVQYLDVPGLAGVPALVDLVDVDSEKWFHYAEEASGVQRWLYRIEGKRLRRLEQSLPPRAKAITLVSRCEAELYKSFCPADSVHAISNGVDLDYFTSPRGF